jgi:hypothetical protein
MSIIEQFQLSHRPSEKKKVKHQQRTSFDNRIRFSFEKRSCMVFQQNSVPGERGLINLKIWLHGRKHKLIEINRQK